MQVALAAINDIPDDGSLELRGEADSKVGADPLLLFSGGSGECCSGHDVGFCSELKVEAVNFLPFMFTN